MAGLEELEQDIIKHPGVLDPEGLHQEFADGMHGQKLDFDRIRNDSPLYGSLVTAQVDFVNEHYQPHLDAVLGTANGANRFALSVAEQLEGVHGLVSEKPKDGKPRLNHMARLIIAKSNVKSLLVLDDTGTTGSSTVQLAIEAQTVAGAESGLKVDVLYIWQRRKELEHLTRAGIGYAALIDKPLPTYSPQECQDNPQGFCARGWELKRRP